MLLTNDDLTYYNLLERFLNSTAKSNHVNVEAVIREMAKTLKIEHCVRK
jgi:hypothetical protein